jgi:methylenetetrahydrofolate reductase (NADPH)
MKITDIFRKYDKTFSFEFFPPKDEISAVDFGINIGQLMKLSPSFVTVTYGAGGSSQERTFAIVDYLQNKIGMTCVAHYTCVNASRKKVYDDLAYLEGLNVKNLMLLRGDPPKGLENFVAPKDGFTYASDLIRFAKENFNFCIAGASYVEKHPEAVSLQTDIDNLKQKVDAGAEFLITQLFFNNEKYFKFLEKIEKAGIKCRIIPGIIPITAFRQIERFTKMSGAKIPGNLAQKLEIYKDDPDATYKIGIENSVEQCKGLLENGAPGIHFYTLNKSRATVEIYESIIN